VALTEDQPIIKPYAQDRWAELQDTRSVPVEVSLDLVEAFDRRWVGLLRGSMPRTGSARSAILNTGQFLSR
jgi:hypothetical protein